MPTNNQCHEFSFFGAPYPDARCIDGYLWDLDKCNDEDGGLYGGGEAPCPFCNTALFIEHITDLDEKEITEMNNDESLTEQDRADILATNTTKADAEQYVKSLFEKYNYTTAQ